jgi:transcriptional regulator with XRE-family HTH domain
MGTFGKAIMPASTTIPSMKQPELGRKIAELRKAKGLTQEELVDLCNISVRTIQRIETGEVIPRSSTVKTILAALDADFKEVAGEDTSKQAPDVSEQEPLQRVEGDGGDTRSALLTRQLHLALVFGIVYFILGFFEGALDFARFNGEALVVGYGGYVMLKLLVLVSFVFFQHGFLVLGQLYNNYLLKAAALVLIAATVVLIGYDIVSLYFVSAGRDAVLMGAALTYGVIGIVYGVALMRLKGPLGRGATYAGFFELVAAGFFLSVALSFLGFIAQLPAEMLEILLLYKAIGLLKGREKEMLAA